MELDEKLIARLGRLSRIELPPGSAVKMASELDRIISYVRKLREVDVSSVEPTALAPTARGKCLREDQPSNGSIRYALKNLAPDLKGPFLRVPVVVKKKMP